jgi:hypothetical protein
MYAANFGRGPALNTIFCGVNEDFTDGRLAVEVYQPFDLILKKRQRRPARRTQLTT